LEKRDDSGMFLSTNCPPPNTQQCSTSVRTSSDKIGRNVLRLSAAEHCCKKPEKFKKSVIDVDEFFTMSNFYKRYT
jgi:hypothetical protein